MMAQTRPGTPVPAGTGGGAANATARSYRQHMANYSSVRALDVWYETIGLDAVMEAVDDRAREVLKRRVTREKTKSSPEFVFPKLVEHRGVEPRFRDDPPLIFHPSAEMFPGAAAEFREPIARYRGSMPEHVRVLFDRYRLCDVCGEGRWHWQCGDHVRRRIVHRGGG